jgi:hypothetical protein
LTGRRRRKNRKKTRAVRPWNYYQGLHGAQTPGMLYFHNIPVTLAQQKFPAQTPGMLYFHPQNLLFL